MMLFFECEKVIRYAGSGWLRLQVDVYFQDDTRGKGVNNHERTCFKYHCITNNIRMATDGLNKQRPKISEKSKLEYLT